MTRGRIGVLLAIALVSAFVLWVGRDSARSERSVMSEHVKQDEVPRGAPSPAQSVDGSSSEERLEQRLAELRASEEELREELEALRLAGETREHFVSRCAVDPGPDCPRAHPPQDVLDARARCGTIAWDEVAMPEFDQEMREELALTDRELNVLRRTVERVNDDVEQALEDNWRRATGEEPPADAFPSRTMALSLELNRRFPDESVVPQIAKELAGHEPRPSAFGDRSPLYWHMRLRVEAGDRLEEGVAEELGADRARELRMATGGWNGGVMYSARLCEDP